MMKRPSSIVPTVFDIFRQVDRITITEPTAYDVLCGKDKTFSKHAGNQLYRELIESHYGSYASANNKQDKMKLTKRIVSSMKQQHGSRFLRKCNKTSTWVELTDAQARDKTSHALRFAEKHQQKQQNQNQQEQGHIRRVSNHDDEDTTSPSSSMDCEDDPLVIYQRQQAILQESMGPTPTAATAQPPAVVPNTVAATTGPPVTAGPPTMLMCPQFSENTLMQGSIRSIDMSIRTMDMDSMITTPTTSQIKGTFDTPSTSLIKGTFDTPSTSFVKDTSTTTPSTSFVKETFDTLRSEDLHAIMDEPLPENEWDTVMTMAS